MTFVCVFVLTKKTKCHYNISNNTSTGDDKNKNINKRRILTPSVTGVVVGVSFGRRTVLMVLAAATAVATAAATATAAAAAAIIESDETLVCNGDCRDGRPVGRDELGSERENARETNAKRAGHER